MRAIVVRVLLVLLGGVVGGAAAAPPDVAFNREIVPLLQRHCQECHRAGGGAPFVLERYEHVYQRRDTPSYACAPPPVPCRGACASCEWGSSS